MRKLSEKSLSNVALHYVRKHSASRKGLVQFLERRVEQEGEVPLSEARALIEQVVARLEQDGYLDDARMAEAKTASLQRQGKSSRVIELKLREKGVDPALAKKAAASTPEVEFESACLLVKRKRLGVDPARKQKDYAVLMRAGFRSDVARRALAGAVEEPVVGAEVVAFTAPRSVASALGAGEACKVLQLPVPARMPEPEAEPEPELGLEAAARLVAKKRLGVDPARKQRDLAVLVRAGFTWDVAKRALAANDH